MGKTPLKIGENSGLWEIARCMGLSTGKRPVRVRNDHGADQFG